MKKLLVLALITGLVSAVSAFGREKEQVPPETVVLDAQKALFDNIGNKVKADFAYATNKEAQFLLEDDKLEQFGCGKDKKLGEIYKTLRKDTKCLFNVTHSCLTNPLHLGRARRIKKDDTIETIEFLKKESEDYHKRGVDLYSTKCETHVIIRKDSLVSNAKYAAEFIWRCNEKKPTDAQLIIINLRKIKFTTAEKLSMEKIAREAVVEWYADLPDSLETEYNFSSMAVGMESVEGKLSGTTFTTVSVPELKGETEFKVSEEDLILYDEAPKTVHTLKPGFLIHISEDLRGIEGMEVDFADLKSIEPVKNEDKKHRKYLVVKAANEFTSQLMLYAITDRKERESISPTTDFGENAHVQVSYLKKEIEDIKDRDSATYLKKLKAEEMSIILSGYPIFDNNMDSAVWNFTQVYIGNSYKDITEKQLHMRYDKESDAYEVEQITVISGSTRKYE